jgi:hypothetical protein
VADLQAETVVKVHCAAVGSMVELHAVSAIGLAAITQQGLQPTTEGPAVCVTTLPAIARSSSSPGPQATGLAAGSNNSSCCGTWRAVGWHPVSATSKTAVEAAVAGSASGKGWGWAGWPPCCWGGKLGREWGRQQHPSSPAAAYSTVQ